MYTNFYSEMKKVFKKYSNKIAIINENGEMIDYNTLIREVNQISHSLLTLGVSAGNKVGIFLTNSPEFVEIFLGLCNIGAVPVLLNSEYTFRELQYAVCNADVTHLIVSEGKQSEVYTEFREYVRNGVDTQLQFVLSETDVITVGKLLSKSHLAFDEDVEFISSSDGVAMILYTSGTTSNPKAVMISHDALLKDLQIQRELFGYNDSDIILSALPLAHIMGLCSTCLLGLYSGSKIIIMKKFKTDKVIELLENYKCTVFNGVPTMFNFIINKLGGHHINTLRSCLIGGSACHKNLLLAMKTKLLVDKVYTGYAQTESLLISLTCNNPSNSDKIGVVGKPIRGVKIKIQKESEDDINGEILIKSELNMLGYYNNPSKTAETLDYDGYLHTGDIGHLDEHGNIIIAGRISDMIIRGGENISPFEVEDVISKYPGVGTVAVFGVEGGIMGQEVCSYIVPTGEPHIVFNDLKRHLESVLARYKIPKYIRFTRELPLTSSGKVKKNELRELFMKELRQEG